MRKYLSIILPLIGVTFAIYWVISSARKPPLAPPLNPPAQNFYAKTIAGTGIIEASGRNINLAPPIPGQVVNIFVKENDLVEKGTKLYQIDDREQEAKINSAKENIYKAEASIATAKSEILNQQAAEQTAVANVEVYKALLIDAEQNLKRDEKLHQAGDIPERIYTSSITTKDTAKARAEQSQAQVNQVKSQLRTANARLKEANASLKVLQSQENELMINLKKLTVIAPQEGRVLQINIRVGEYVSSTPQVTPILFGDTDFLQLRVDVDEINASRLPKGSQAIGHLKGDSSKSIPLEFVRIDPYILPKKSLTGDNVERVDVRVLQIIYKFHPPNFPVYVGQQLDVFIDISGNG